MRPEFIQTLRLKYLHVNWYHYYGSSVEREWLQMNWYHYYGSSVEREWLQRNLNVFSVQRMRSEIIKSSKHLDWNIYMWTDITTMVLPLNENDYKWTWMSFQFKGWEVAWFSVSHMGKFKTNHFKSCHESVRSHFWKRNR